MGSRIDLDIDEIERFAVDLQQFSSELEQSTYRIEGRFRQLGATWHDDQYEKFAGEWQATFRAINKYLDSCMGYVQHLKIKAARLRDARGGRF